jgi:hypothetical protein
MLLYVMDEIGDDDSKQFSSGAFPFDSIVNPE